VDVVTTSEVSVSLTVDYAQSVPDIVAERALVPCRSESGRAIVWWWGEGLRTTRFAARCSRTVTDINVSLISQGASRVNPQLRRGRSARARSRLRLHEALFERDGLDLDRRPRPASWLRDPTSFR